MNFEITCIAQQLFAVLLLLIGLVLVIVYIALLPRKEEADESPSFGLELWEIEYKYLNKEIERKERSMIMMGSIIIPACFILMGQALQTRSFCSRLLIVALSTGLYSTWLFTIQLTDRILGNKTYARLRGLEKQMGIHVHRFGLDVREKSRTTVFRINHWLFYMIGLYAIGTLILLIS